MLKRKTQTTFTFTSRLNTFQSCKKIKKKKNPPKKRYHCFCTGFVTSKVACCGQGPYNGLGLCTPASTLCPNRDVYAFWDAFHPSERANGLIVQQIVSGSTEYMHPMNLSTIMALDSRN